jgi:hypothetical protein
VDTTKINRIKTVAENATQLKPKDPTKDEYTFAGWLTPSGDEPPSRGF